MRINTDNLRCAYCLTIDVITLILLLLIPFNAAYVLPALFALGFAYAGIAKEVIYQIERYNYPTEKAKAWYQLFYYVIPAAFSASIASFLPVAALLLMASFLFMTVINSKRYTSLDDPARAVQYDMAVFIPFILGVIGLFYVFF